MGILCDTQIRELIGIEPFEENTKRPGQISFGVSSYGYDLRVGPVFKIFTNVNSEIVDPKRFSERSFVTVDCDKDATDHVLIPPNSFALCETIETISMPRGYLAICVGKSTYARCGIIVNVTPIEPEWRGQDHTGNQQHDSPAGEDLCQRRNRAVLPARRARVCSELRGQEREVSGPSRVDTSEGGLDDGHAARGGRSWLHFVFPSSD